MRYIPYTQLPTKRNTMPYIKRGYTIGQLLLMAFTAGIAFALFVSMLYIF